MDSLTWALSWLVVVAIGLAPMLMYWLGRVLRGRAVRRNVAVPEGRQRLLPTN
jgi:hypothetical protein